MRTLGSVLWWLGISMTGGLLVYMVHGCAHGAIEWHSRDPVGFWDSTVPLAVVSLAVAFQVVGVALKNKKPADGRERGREL